MAAEAPWKLHSSPPSNGSNLQLQYPQKPNYVVMIERWHLKALVWYLPDRESLEWRNLIITVAKSSTPWIPGILGILHKYFYVLFLIR